MPDRKPSFAHQLRRSTRCVAWGQAQPFVCPWARSAPSPHRLCLKQDWADPAQWGEDLEFHAVALFQQGGVRLGSESSSLWSMGAPALSFVRAGLERLLSEAPAAPATGAKFDSPQSDIEQHRRDMKASGRLDWDHVMLCAHKSGPGEPPGVYGFGARGVFTRLGGPSGLLERQQLAAVKAGEHQRTHAVAIKISRGEHAALCEALSVLDHAGLGLDHASQLKRAVADPRQLRRSIVDAVRISKNSEAESRALLRPLRDKARFYKQDNPGASVMTPVQACIVALRYAFLYPGERTLEVRAPAPVRPHRAPS